jgi:hypothetical protein
MAAAALRSTAITGAPATGCSARPDADDAVQDTGCG